MKRRRFTRRLVVYKKGKRPFPKKKKKFKQKEKIIMIGDISPPVVSIPGSSDLSRIILVSMIWVMCGRVSMAGDLCSY